MALVAAPDTQSLADQPPAFGPGEVHNIAIDAVVGGDLIKIGHPIEQHCFVDGFEQQPLWRPLAFLAGFLVLLLLLLRLVAAGLVLGSSFPVLDNDLGQPLLVGFDFL